MRICPAVDRLLGQDHRAQPASPARAFVRGHLVERLGRLVLRGRFIVEQSLQQSEVELTVASLVFARYLCQFSERETFVNRLDFLCEAGFDAFDPEVRFIFPLKGQQFPWLDRSGLFIFLLGCFF